MSNFLRCLERQEQVREEKVIPSSWPSSVTTEESQILLSLACKMAENHLATSGTQARYQLDIAQIHQAIYHCHSCEEKELYPACVGCAFKPSLCYIHTAPPQYFCRGFPAASPLNSLPQLLCKTGSLQEHGWQRDYLKSHSSSGVKDKTVRKCLFMPGWHWHKVLPTEGHILLWCCAQCPALPQKSHVGLILTSGPLYLTWVLYLQKCKMFYESSMGHLPRKYIGHLKAVQIMLRSRITQWLAAAFLSERGALEPGPVSDPSVLMSLLSRKRPCHLFNLQSKWWHSFNIQ